MKESIFYNKGIDAFMTGTFSSPIHAISRETERMSKEDRFEFANGFKYAQNIFLSN